MTNSRRRWVTERRIKPGQYPPNYQPPPTLASTVDDDDDDIENISDDEEEEEDDHVPGAFAIHCNNPDQEQPSQPQEWDPTEQEQQPLADADSCSGEKQAEEADVEVAPTIGDLVQRNPSILENIGRRRSLWFYAAGTRGSSVLFSSSFSPPSSSRKRTIRIAISGVLILSAIVVAILVTTSSRHHHDGINRPEYCSNKDSSSSSSSPALLFDPSCRCDGELLFLELDVQQTFWDTLTSLELNSTTVIETPSTNCSQINLVVLTLAESILQEQNNNSNMTRQRLQQRFSLVHLYAVQGGPFWTRSTHWISPDEHECLWYGVRCDSNTSSLVVQLIMPKNNISGIWDETSLRHLTNLESINFTGNAIQGSLRLPAQRSLPSIESLDFSKNKLNGTLPTELGRLTRLKSINLESNELSGTLVKFAPSLRHLNLADNFLEGQVPIGDLTSLSHCDFSLNRLDGPLPDLQLLTNLEYLDIFQNFQFASTIPRSIGMLTRLTHINLAENIISGPLPSIKSLRRLKFLDLGSNSLLSGDIPSELYLLTNLNGVDLSATGMSGSISSRIQNLTNLEFLGLGGLSLTGTIPSEIGRLTLLERLFIGSNLFHGSIPTEIGKLKGLRFLRLGGNEKLTGTLPSEIGQLLMLEMIDVGETNLVGPVPSGFYELSKSNPSGFFFTRSCTMPCREVCPFPCVASDSGV